MFSKALFFCAPEICALIMASADPARHKKFGRSVPGFSEWKWDQVKRRVARVGNWYKFTDARNDRMERVLVGTGERELVEASRRDRVWGGADMRRKRRKGIGSFGGDREGEGEMKVNGEGDKKNGDVEDGIKDLSLGIAESNTALKRLE